MPTDTGQASHSTTACRATSFPLPTLGKKASAMQAKRRQRSETRRRRRGWDTGWRRRWDYVSLFFHYGVIGEDCGLSRLESGLVGGRFSPAAAAAAGPCRGRERSLERPLVCLRGSGSSPPPATSSELRCFPPPFTGSLMETVAPVAPGPGAGPFPSLFPPGLHGIYGECRRLYPEQPNPLQVTAILKYW